MACVRLGTSLATPHVVGTVALMYDLVTISEAPNDEAVAKLTLALGSLGNIQTETLRAFTEDEYRKLIAALP